MFQRLYLTILDTPKNAWTKGKWIVNKSPFIITVRPATALFLVPGINSAIENSANGGSCYLVLCKFPQRIVL